MNLVKPNTFNKYDIKITADTAKTLLELIQGLDYHTMRVGEVIALNGLWVQLEEIVESSKK